MTFTPDLSKTKARTWWVLKWITNAWVNLGFCDEPTCVRELKLEDIKVPGQMGDQVMGKRIMGVKATLTLKLREITLANRALNYPWFAGVVATNPIPLMPAAVGGDLYSYAAKYRFHPMDLPDEAVGEVPYDRSQDILLLAAVVTSKDEARSDGKESYIPLELEAMPDRTKLPNLVLGYIGEEPQA
ncbi:MAG: hypothetical protein ABFD92_00045 [Planctomycetaceae bacterium]|nr:hypothetical protein [Planctomycetaceae bacterium]